MKRGAFIVVVLVLAGAGQSIAFGAQNDPLKNQLEGLGQAVSAGTTGAPPGAEGCRGGCTVSWPQPSPTESPSSCPVRRKDCPGSTSPDELACLSFERYQSCAQKCCGRECHLAPLKEQRARELLNTPQLRSWISEAVEAANDGLERDGSKMAVTPAMVLGSLFRESRMDPLVGNSTGDGGKGLGQYTPTNKRDPDDPDRSKQIFCAVYQCEGEGKKKKYKLDRDGNPMLVANDEREDFRAGFDWTHERPDCGDQKKRTPSTPCTVKCLDGKIQKGLGIWDEASCLNQPIEIILKNGTKRKVYSVWSAKGQIFAKAAKFAKLLKTPIRTAKVSHCKPVEVSAIWKGGDAHVARYLVGTDNRGIRVMNSITAYVHEYQKANQCSPPMRLDYGRAWVQGDQLADADLAKVLWLYGHCNNRCHVESIAGLCGDEKTGYFGAFSAAWRGNP